MVAIPDGADSAIPGRREGVGFVAVLGVTGVGFAIGVTGAGLEPEVAIAEMAAGAAPTCGAVPTEPSPAAS